LKEGKRGFASRFGDLAAAKINAALTIVKCAGSPGGPLAFKIGRRRRVSSIVER
jgi:hypothetical protein